MIAARARSGRLSRAFAASLAVTTAGCSHMSPYYGQPAPSIKAPDRAAIAQRVLLIGDAGAPEATEPVLLTLRSWASDIPEKTIVVFLGDNLYPKGLPAAGDPRRSEGERRLGAQINAVRGTGATALFLPGNHDWGGGGRAELERILNEEAFVEGALGDPDAFVPSDGCAGPVARDTEHVRIIALDTEWFLREEKLSPCRDDETSILGGLDSLLAGARDRVILVVAHHPLLSRGVHGGFYDWKAHVFPLRALAPWLWVPLPGVGSLYPLARSHVFTAPEDLRSARYEAMARALNGVFARHRPLVYAAGHDHSLQVFRGRSMRYHLVSGAGSGKKITTTSHEDDTLFAHAHVGFMSLDVLTNGHVLLRVVEPENDVVYSRWLE